MSEEILQNKTNNPIPWIPIIELAVLAFTTLGTTITLFLHSDSKMEAFRKESLEFRSEVLSIQREMAQEMKDFHGRLIAIEERNKK